MDDEGRRLEQSAAAESAGDQVPDAKVDWQAALEVTAGDVDLLVEVLEAYQIEAPQMLAMIHEALEQRDAPVLHRAAHTIKNGCYNLGAQATGDIAFELELMGKEADFDRVPPLLVQLESHLQQIDREVRQFLAERRHG